jgi:hypothetical protein
MDQVIATIILCLFVSAPVCLLINCRSLFVMPRGRVSIVIYVAWAEGVAIVLSGLTYFYSMFYFIGFGLVFTMLPATGVIILGLLHLSIAHKLQALDSPLTPAIVLHACTALGLIAVLLLIAIQLGAAALLNYWLILPLLGAGASAWVALSLAL